MASFAKNKAGRASYRHPKKQSGSDDHLPLAMGCEVSICLGRAKIGCSSHGRQEKRHSHCGRATVEPMKEQARFIGLRAARLPGPTGLEFPCRSINNEDPASRIAGDPIGVRNDRLTREHTAYYADPVEMDAGRAEGHCPVR